MNGFFKFLIILCLVIGLCALSLSLWLKTDSAKNKITSLLENVISEELGIQTKISGLNISLPVIAKVDNLIFYNEDKSESINIKNFNINILPSLFSFWEITIWSLSVEELRITKIPNIHTKNSDNTTAGMFNPDIIIQTLNIEKIILDQELTKQKEEIIVNLNSYLKFDSNDQKLYFTLENQLISPAIDEQTKNLLELVGSYDIEKNRLQINSLNFQSDIAEITGDLLIDESKNQFTGKIQYATSLLGPLISEAATSNLEGAIKLSGSYKEPHIQTNGNLTIDLPKNDYFKFLPISWDGAFRLVKNEIAGNIKIVQQEGITFAGDVGYKDKKLYLQNFKGLGDDFESDIELTFNPDNSMLLGTSSIKATTLKTLEKSLPFLSNGAIDLKMTYSTPNGKNQHLDANGKIAGLYTDLGNCDLIDIDINTEDLWNFKLSPSKLHLSAVNINDFIIRDIMLKAHSEGKALKIDGTVLGHQHYPINLNFATMLTSIPEETKIVISNLSGQLGATAIQNKEDIILSYGARATLKLNNLLIGQGLINANSEISDSAVKTHIDFKDITTSIIPALLPQSFKGALLQGEIKLKGAPSAPALNSIVNITDITKTKSDNKLTLNVTANIKDSKTKISAGIFDKEQKISNLDVVLTSKFSLSPFVYEIEDTKSFSADLSAAENSNLLSIIPMPLGSTLTGDIKGSINAAGTLKAPIVSGNIKITNGNYNYKLYGISLNNITGEISADGNQILFNQLMIHDQFNNTLKSSGKLLLNQNKDFTITAQTDKFNLINTPYLQGEVKGNLNIKGDSNAAVSTGKFTLGPMEIKIPEHFQEDIPALNIVEITKNNTIVSTDEEPYKMKLDVALNTSNKVYVRGWGVDTQLKGNLHITGYAHQPLINGTLKSIHGKYQEFGKSLIVKEGVLTFDGPISPSPYLNIVGAMQVGSNEIRLILSGSIQDPDVSIESTPSLSQEEALSMLLFGQSTETLSAFQAFQLADAVSRVSGHGGGFDPLGTGRKILGVDEIKFNADEDDISNSSIGVGKHLTDKVYFEVEGGRQAGSAKTKIEVQISPKISIEGTQAQEGSSSLGVNWRFDY